MPRRPVDEVVPVPALARLEGRIAVAEAFGRQLVPGCVVRVAVGVLQEAVEAVLDVLVEVRLFGRAPVGAGGVALDFDLGLVVRSFPSWRRGLWR